MLNHDTPPIRDVAETEPASRALFHLRAFDMDVETALSGHLGTFARSVNASVDDDNTNVFSLGYMQPAFERVTWYTAERVMTLRLGSADTLNYPVNWRPRSFAFYHQYRQTNAAMSANQALWSISNAAASGARTVLDYTGSVMRLRHHNGTSEVTVSLGVMPAAGDSVEMWGYVYDDGSVQLYQSVNGAAATNTARSSANNFAPGGTWAATARLRFGALGTTAGVASWLRTFKLVAGHGPSLETLQQFF